MDISNRLGSQLTFLIELDKLKEVLRRTITLNSKRQENTAEHSWHAALMAVVLAEYANEPIDALKAAKMLLIHDVVEIDAGDTFHYDTQAHADKEVREKKAADRLFNLLPSDQSKELRTLWDEFEARKTMESKFANAIDRLNPIMLNYQCEGLPWKRFNLTKQQVMDKNKHIADGSKVLWEYASDLINKAADKGFLRK